MAAPELWQAPNNPSLSNQIRFMLDSLRSYLGRLTTYIGTAFTYTDAQVPVGTVRMTLSIVDEPGWLELDGGVLVNGQNVYPKLWAIIPASMKSGSNINLPDMRERVPRDGTVAQIAAFIGSNTATLSIANLASHDHTQQGTFGSGGITANHVHGPGSGAQFQNFTAFAGAQNEGAGGNAFPTSNTTNTVSSDHAHFTTISGQTGAAGSGTPFDVTNASVYLKFVVRVS